MGESRHPREAEKLLHIVSLGFLTLAVLSTMLAAGEARRVRRVHVDADTADNRALLHRARRDVGRCVVVTGDRRALDSPMDSVALRGIGALALFCACGTALAHDVPTESAWSLPWVFEPWVIACLLLSAVLYIVGLTRLWHRAGVGRGVRVAQAAAFAAGWLFLVIAVVSPLDPLGARLFAAHMVQHEILMVIVAPLMVLSRPLAVWVWALPLALRRYAGRFTQHSAWARPWHVLTAPLSGWLLHAAALWLWHVPWLFDAALVNDDLHTLQHASFLVTALIFWWAMLGRPDRANQGAALAYLFTTMIYTGALGALLTLSPTVWYSHYLSTTAEFGISALEDQQLGGLIMWVPAGLAYFAAGLALAARWLRAARQVATYSTRRSAA